MMRRLLSLLLLATLMGVAGFAADNHEVVVHYDGTTATVDVAEDITQFITVKIKDADITVTQSADVTEEIIYRLSGPGLPLALCHRRARPPHDVSRQ